MRTAREARRLCLTDTPQAAAAAFERRGVELPEVQALLSSASGEPERHRSETIELSDAWGRTTRTSLYVPETRGPARRGVIVGLHGVGGSGEELEPKFRELADACGAVLLCPTAQQPVDEESNFDLVGLFGRRFSEARWTPDPGDFPMRALAWARENLSVDPDRCALVGASMGGIAAWNTTARCWDRTSMTGSVNGAPSVWELFGPDRTMRELLPNLLNLPLAVIHGGRDKQIPSALDRDAVEHLRSLGHRRISFVEVAEGEHQLSTMRFVPGTPQFDSVVRCFRSSRREPWPRRIVHRARESGTGRAHWVEISHITPGRAAHVEARATGRSGIDIQVTGASRVRVLLSEQLVRPGRVFVRVNGEPREYEFRPSLTDVISTYAESGADPGRTAQMTIDIEVSEIREREG